MKDFSDLKKSESFSSLKKLRRASLRLNGFWLIFGLGWMMFGIIEFSSGEKYPGNAGFLILSLVIGVFFLLFGLIPNILRK